MRNDALFFLSISVYKHRNNKGEVYGREIRVDSDPLFVGRALSVNDLRFLFKKGIYKLRFDERKPSGRIFYRVVKKNKSGTKRRKKAGI
jgi:hypothetical protein